MTSLKDFSQNSRLLFGVNRAVFKEGAENKSEAGPMKPGEGATVEPEDKLNPKEEEQAKNKMEEIKKAPKVKGKLAEAQKAFKEKYEQLKKLDDKEANTEEKRKECVRFLRVALKDGLEVALKQQEQLNVLHDPQELKAVQDYLLKDGLNTALAADRTLSDWREREGKFLYTNSQDKGFVDKWNSSIDQSQKINAAIQTVYKLRDAKSENPQEWFDAYIALKSAVGKSSQGEVSYGKLEGEQKKPEAPAVKPPEKKTEAPKVKPPEKKPGAPKVKPPEPPNKPEAPKVKPPEPPKKPEAPKVKPPEPPKKPEVVAAIAPKKPEAPKAKPPEPPKKPEVVAAVPPKKPEAPKAKPPEPPKKPEAVAAVVPPPKKPEGPKPGEPKVDETGRKYFDSYDNMKVYLTNQFGSDAMRDLNRKLRLSADTIAKSIKASQAGENEQVNAPISVNVEGQKVAFTMEIPKAKANINKLSSPADIYRISGVKFVLREAAPDMVLADVNIKA